MWSVSRVLQKSGYFARWTSKFRNKLYGLVEVSMECGESRSHDACAEK